MNLLGDVLLTLCGVVVLIPLVVLAAECLIAALPLPRRNEDFAVQPRTIVLIPAHNEESVLGQTLSSLAPQVPSWARILVVADNCTDRTATVAREVGVEVVERFDPERRGKGYALQCGLSHLADNPPDVVLVLDADCLLSDHAIEQLATRAYGLQRPVQADNVVQLPASPRINARISAFAFRVRNRLRPRGLARLGLPCQLMGTGMAIPYAQFLRASVAGSDLVEDMVLGLELAGQGVPPLYVGDAHVVSAQPDDAKAALGQHRRWEHGHLQTLVKHGPKLLWRGLSNGSVGLLAMALDLLVPPLALMSLLTFGYSAIAVAAWYAFDLHWGLYWAVADMVLLFSAVGLSWILEGRSILKLHHFLQVPLYILWKVPLYISLAFRKRQKTWVRTQRTPSAAASATVGDVNPSARQPGERGSDSIPS